MTTETVVKANHGWPVKVTGVHPKDGTLTNYGGIVPAGEERAFHCHSSMDLVIHEIQPDESDFAPPVALSTEDASKPASDDGNAGKSYSTSERGDYDHSVHSTSDGKGDSDSA